MLYLIKFNPISIYELSLVSTQNVITVSLGAIISKCKGLKHVGYNIFEVMYNSSVKPVLEYGSGVWVMLMEMVSIHYKTEL